MSRLVALSLLCGLVGGGIARLVAAPAPFARPSKVWITGWETPVDPVGDTLFERGGEKLTITLPCKIRPFPTQAGKLDAPRLLRDVRGNFIAQVRVAATFRPNGHAPPVCGLWAGIALIDRGQFVRVERKQVKSPFGLPQADNLSITRGQNGFGVVTRGSRSNLSLSEPAYLRLERRGDLLRALWSRDGKKWLHVAEPPSVILPCRLKVGVFAKATAEAGLFKAVFDQFTLTPLGEAGGE
jgi:hypothetical protein